MSRTEQTEEIQKHYGFQVSVVKPPLPPAGETDRASLRPPKVQEGTPRKPVKTRRQVRSRRRG